MKRKLLLTATALVLCLGLTACGNPLKQLPEATGENIYDEEEETTGNELADDIIDELMDEAGFPGEDVVSFVVNDRDDDEEGKERSDLSIEIITTSDMAEYTYYYEVVCKYSKDRGWRIKEYELDDKEESTITPLAGVTKEQIEETILNNVYSCYYGDTYVYLNDGNITDIVINSEEIVPGVVNAEVYEDEYPKERLSVTFTWAGDYCSYTRDLDLVYYFYQSDEEEPWGEYDYTLAEEYTTELSAETLEQLSDEQMLADYMSAERRIGNFDITLTEDLIESCTFEDYNFSGNWCSRTAEISLKDTSFFDITLTVDFSYNYDETSWELYTIYTTVNAEMQDFSGNYAGEVYDSSDEKIATIYYSFLDVDTENGSFSGVVKWVPEGTDAASAEAVDFTGEFYSADYMELYPDFDDYLIQDGWWSSFSYDYLYYNVETQTMDSVSYGRTYSLEKID